MELNHLTQENVDIKFYLNLVYYLLNAYINMDDVYFEINHRNGLIYILTQMEVKNVI